VVGYQHFVGPYCLHLHGPGTLVSYHSTTEREGNITVCTPIFLVSEFLERRREDKRFWTEW